MKNRPPATISRALRPLATVRALLLSVALGLVLPFIAPGQAQAATLLAIDLGGTGAETGFQPWSVGGDGVSIRTTTLGGYDLTLAGGVNASDLTTLNPNYSLNQRLRSGLSDSGSFTLGDLLIDRVVATVAAGKTNEAGSGLLLQLSGFEASTQYEIQLWGYEHNNRGTAKNVEFFDLSSGSEISLGSYTTTINQLPLTNDDFSITAIVTSDAAGNIILKSRSNFDGIGIFNGVTVTAVPEPGLPALLLIGSTALLLQRRRRRGGSVISHQRRVIHPHTLRVRAPGVRCWESKVHSPQFGVR